MKKLLTLIAGIFLLCIVGKAQYVNIPDTNFRNYLQYSYPGCFNSSGQLDTTCAAILAEDSITMYYNGNPNEQIISMEGIVYFKNLLYLNCSNAGPISNFSNLPNSLREFNCESSGVTSFESLPSSLVKLNCSYTAITSLPALPGSLKYLSCYSTSLTALPALPASLEYLDPSGSRITSFPALPVKLRYLDCSFTRSLTSLPTLPDSLRHLRCGDNNLTSLPTLPSLLDSLVCSNTAISLPSLPAKMTYLDCSYGIMTYLPPLPDSLLTLLCYGIHTLTSLPALPVKLSHLECTGDNISVMPALPASLKTLKCGYNLLTSLPPLPNGLITLWCDRNNLTTLPAIPSTLQELSCYENQLQTITAVSGSLRSFVCYRNQLTSLPAVLPNTLSRLVCSGNQLTRLPLLPKGLDTLMCENNRLTELPALPDSLIRMNCSGNNIYCLPELPSFANAINEGGANVMIDDKIKCLPSQRQNVYLAVIDINGQEVAYTLPLCTPLNNVNQCRSFPVIAGTVFFDNNNNGIKDPAEPAKANTKMQLSDGVFTFTNSNGYFELGTTATGSYTITPNNTHPYFNIAPASATYNFTSYDTLVTKDFALQANASRDSLVVKITPVNWAARPGFNFPYLVHYENAGTTTISSTVVLNYDNTRLNYDSSSNASVNNNGSSLSLNAGNFVPGQQGNFIAYFRVKQNAVIGDSLFAKATIGNSSITAIDSSIVVIRGSFDPNDKAATPVLSPSQVAAGKYIDYTIRFQNTGTDTAFNVILSDTLSSFLQVSTLQLINTSHPCKVTVKGNIVFFEFLNILLPDSNVNELKSHGFVSFRIKPISNVAVNTNIPNKAAIYFDYNSPVITNTAITQIKNPVLPVPLRLLTFTAMWQNNNAATITWNTANEINVRQYIIEQSLSGSSFTSIGAEPAKGRQYNSYNKSIMVGNNEAIYFRLKMIDMDGQFSYSPVVILRKNKSKNGFSILNNAAGNTLYVSISDPALINSTARIINAQGAVVKTVLLQNMQEQVDIHTLAAGLYILQTEKGNQQFIVGK